MIWRNCCGPMTHDNLNGKISKHGFAGSIIEHHSTKSSCHNIECSRCRLLSWIFLLTLSFDTSTTTSSPYLFSGIIWRTAQRPRNYCMTIRKRLNKDTFTIQTDHPASYKEICCGAKDLLKVSDQSCNTIFISSSFAYFKVNILTTKASAGWIYYP